MLYIGRIFQENPNKSFRRRQPLTRFENQAVGFTNVPVVKNKLQSIIPAVCKKAIYKGTRLIIAFVLLEPQDCIYIWLVERTGLRSLETLRMYEKTNTSQHKCKHQKRTLLSIPKMARLEKPDSSRVDSVVQNTSTLSNSVPVAMRFKDCQVNLTVT